MQDAGCRLVHLRDSLAQLVDCPSASANQIQPDVPPSPAWPASGPDRPVVHKYAAATVPPRLLAAPRTLFFLAAVD
ncbi:hypothetical protein Cob_v004208 [Colletotrichum orbiculare MAFF 240422]|uniref:Uncharacterized protein n=1 Tax=Colletotrichum orbiculare (strain 104-T / ATCC 96160 / CBS 514.97 / LARS 414 / MAFF 240422) TaxID=1213857 RepID=A0A484FYF2_COLOR|nr:hypothetical protein Cob_v004208 [Colletotrichum orbiculare MAFF 240422]